MSRVRIVSASSNERVDLAVVILNWNVKDLVIRNLETLLTSQGSISMRIIVVDNASHDGSVEEIRRRFPDIPLIANTENLGFAKGVNQGIAIARARHVLLLNPDMCVTPEACARTVAYLDTHARVGVLGGKLLSADGSVYPSVRRFPDVWSQVAILLKLSRLFPRLLDRYLWKDFDYECEQIVPSVRGSYFAISGPALEKLGGLDERFFIWFEEVDYCMQAIRAGFEVAYVPSIEAQDLVGRSFAQRKLFWKQRQFSRSMAQYFWKWHPAWRALLISCVRPLPVVVAWFHDRLFAR